jgi:glycosyltransferase involved in cell wall biosynthesis
LTIVLPVHNGESRLRGCVGEILELASELTPDFSVLIVDDGSTDDTFSAAEELSAQYPQISVRRQRFRRGLGPTIDGVRGRIRSDVVIVHDGVSRIDPNQVRTLWRNHFSQQSALRASQASPADSSALAAAARTHESLARAHERLLGFQLLTSIPADAVPLEEWTPVSPRPRTVESPVPARRGVGEIPALPRPKFLTALARFAFGE